MKRRNKDAHEGSMDMLLDTMCNTFGGVCFIALMVSLISASLPKQATDVDLDEPTVSESDIVSKEMAMLTAKRDQLKSAIEIQQEFVGRNVSNYVTQADVDALALELADNEEKMREYEKKRVEYLDELAKLKTSSQYSKREAARLSRLLAELKEQAESPLFSRRRAVRTPREREIQGLDMIDLWLHNRRLYVLENPQQVRREIVSDRIWDANLIEGQGVRVDDEFFEDSGVWRNITSRLSSRVYVRMFTDTASFEELCILRDALISRGSMYNWKIWEKPTIRFVTGYDGQVQ